MTELRWAARTDVGRRRARNEDAHLAARPIFAVADGMGGHARGDVAAALAIEALGSLPATFQRTELLECIRAAHQEISLQAASTEEGMGTTLTGIAFLGRANSTVLVFNVGDSRVYRVRDGRLEQLTHDHSVVQELIDAGEITTDEAASHPERNVVTRALGDGGHLTIDWAEHESRSDDRYLVCSDGLMKELDDPAIAGIVSDGDPTLAADRLVEAALANGGRDNVTVAVVDVVRASPTGAGSFELDADTNPRAIDVPTQPTAEAIGAPS